MDDILLNDILPHLFDENIFVRWHKLSYLTEFDFDGILTILKQTTDLVIVVMKMVSEDSGKFNIRCHTHDKLIEELIKI